MKWTRNPAVGLSLYCLGLAAAFAGRFSESLVGFVGVVVGFLALPLTLITAFPSYAAQVAAAPVRTDDLKPLGPYDAVDGMGDRGRMWSLRAGGLAFGALGGAGLLTAAMAEQAAATALLMMLSVPLGMISVYVWGLRRASLKRIVNGEEVRPGEAYPS